MNEKDINKNIWNNYKQSSKSLCKKKINRSLLPYKRLWAKYESSCRSWRCCIWFVIVWMPAKSPCCCLHESTHWYFWLVEFLKELSGVCFCSLTRILKYTSVLANIPLLHDSQAHSDSLRSDPREAEYLAGRTTSLLGRRDKWISMFPRNIVLHGYNYSFWRW
jgi:hypothetical protein